MIINNKNNERITKKKTQRLVFRRQCMNHNLEKLIFVFFIIFAQQFLKTSGDYCSVFQNKELYHGLNNKKRCPVSHIFNTVGTRKQRNGTSPAWIVAGLRAPAYHLALSTSTKGSNCKELWALRVVMGPWLLYKENLYNLWWRWGEIASILKGTQCFNFHRVLVSE